MKMHDIMVIVGKLEDLHNTCTCSNYLYKAVKVCSFAVLVTPLIYLNGITGRRTSQQLAIEYAHKYIQGIQPTSIYSAVSSH